MVVLTLALGAAPAQAFLSTTRIAANLERPVLVTAPLSDARFFIVEQRGVIKLWKNGLVQPVLFLDIRTKVLSGGLQGLLGLAFHPDYGTNGAFFVNYTNLDGHTVVERYQVSGNPDVANVNSASQILFVEQPHVDHNGGYLAFGPDSYLYIAMGDGGEPGDPNEYAQNPGELLGKVLRIDVDSASPYAIPPDNPFVSVPGYREEIWAIGTRNPWGIHFDPLTGDLWMADVGQVAWEELNFQAASSPGGENYGWRRLEGTHCYQPPVGCQQVGDTPPIHEYPHSAGRCSIVGGAVYRGDVLTGMQGAYFFADYCTNQIWTIRYDGAQVTELIDRSSDLLPGGGFAISRVVGIWPDGLGQLHVIDRGNGNTDGEIFRVGLDPVAVDPPSGADRALVLSPATPNPFRSRTRLSLSGTDSARVEGAEVVDLTGRVLRRLTVRRDGAGGLVEWDGRDSLGRDLPSGVYWIRLELVSGASATRVQLLR